jgi:predicted nucleic acid-binding protein
VSGGIVSDATPLIYLAKAGKIGLLRTVFGRVIIPEEVKVEVVDRGKQLGEADSYIVERAINDDDGWLKVLSVEVLETPIRLEPGEAAVLSLAKKLGLREVLVDEVSARAAARLLDLTPRGTIFVLLRALEKKEMNLDEFLRVLNQMIGEGFRLREEVYIEAVREVRRITG